MTHTDTMIKRQALLISAAVNKNAGTHLPAELEATRQFLLSPSGGAWLENEILILRNPTQTLLTKQVAELNADYTITCFFGKSFPGSTDRHFLVLPDSDYIEDTDLLNGSERQLVLIADEGSSSPIPFKNTVPRPEEYQRARAMYNQWIEVSEAGKMIMHGSEHSTSPTDGKEGGLFMRKLLQVAQSVVPTSNRFHLKSILAAGHETPDLLLEEGHEDGPAITWSEGNIKLPFALALPLPNTEVKKGPETSNDKGWALGLLILGLLFNLE